MRVFSGARRPAALAVVVALGAALLMSTTSATDASWADSEWTGGAVGTTDCAASEGGFTARSAGRALSGSLFGVDLDQLVEASGLTVTHDGQIAHAQPPGAVAADPGPDAFADPLNVTALQSVNINLGGGLLKFPLDTDTGVLGQYGRASSSGVAAAASGYITHSGGIGLDSGTGYPELASLNLSGLLAAINPAAASAIGDIADVSLEIGALAGRATVDGCALAWGTDSADAIARDYLASSVDLLVTSGTVSSLATAVSGVVDTLAATVSGLGANTGFLTGLGSAVADLLNPVLGILGLGSITVDSFNATINTTELQRLVSQPFGDASGIATVDPTAGTVRVNTAALLAKAYPDQYSDRLNGLAPNTELLINSATVDVLSGVLSGVLADWVAQINDALTATANSITVRASTTISLLGLGTISATIGGGTEPTLAALRAGGVPATVTANFNLGVLGPLLNGLVAGVINVLVNNLGSTVASAVDNTIATLAAVPTGVVDLAGPVVVALNDLYGAMFGSGVVSLTVNAQNRPFDGSVEPEGWQHLPDGQYDVAALRVGVLGAISDDDVHLYLGRGSVGPICTLAGRCVGP